MFWIGVSYVVLATLSLPLVYTACVVAQGKPKFIALAILPNVAFVGVGLMTMAGVCPSPMLAAPPVLLFCIARTAYPKKRSVQG